MYTDKEKEIYILPHSNLGVDPLEVKRKLIILSKGQLNDWITEFNTVEDEVAKATVEDSIITVARAAFKLGSPSEGGVTDAVVLEYLAHFLEWLSTPFDPIAKSMQSGRPCTGCQQKK
jgi:hypothetical protein